jgi:hypothetical protein
MPDSNHAREVALLQTEIEALKVEQRNLLRATGAAAIFIAKLDSHALPEATYHAADILAGALNALSEDVLRDAIELIRRESGERLSHDHDGD